MTEYTDLPAGANDQSDPSNWLRGYVDENNRKMYDTATIPQLNLGDIFQLHHGNLAFNALKQIQEIGDFALIAQEEKTIIIDGKEFNLSISRVDGKINGFMLKGADGLEMHLLSGLYTGEEQRLEIHTSSIAGEPLHAELKRVERYGVDG